MQIQFNTYQREGCAPIPKKESTSKTMSVLKDRKTKSEILLRKALRNEDIRGYQLQWKNEPGKPEVSFLGKKLAIFANGYFLHRCPHGQLRIGKIRSFGNVKFKTT